MVRADRFIGSRIAESENEKFLWWAEGTKFSNVQCDWWARALGNMDLLPGVFIVRANSRGWSRPLRRIIPCKAPSRSSPAGGLWSGQCTGKLCRVRAIISRSFPFRKWIPLAAGQSTEGGALPGQRDGFAALGIELEPLGK